MKRWYGFLLWMIILFLSVQFFGWSGEFVLAAETEGKDGRSVVEDIMVDADEDAYAWSFRGDTAVLTIEYDQTGDGIGLKVQSDTIGFSEKVIYTSEDREVAVVDEDGRLTRCGLGESWMTVEVSYIDKGIAGAEYEKLQYRFLLIVRKQILLKDIVWNPIEKAEYQGENRRVWTISGSYKDVTEALMEEEPLYIEVNALVAVDGEAVLCNAGTYNECLIIDLDEESAELDLAATNQYNDASAGGSYFVLALDDLTPEDLLIRQEGIVTIDQKELHVAVRYPEYIFEKDVWDSINIEVMGLCQEVVLKQEDQAFVQSAGDDLSQMIKGIQLILAGDAAEDMETLYVKKYENCIVPNLKDINEQIQNYRLVCNVSDCADLIICPYDISKMDVIELLDIRGTNYHIEYGTSGEGSKIWMKGTKDNAEYAAGRINLYPSERNTRAFEYDRVILTRDSEIYDGSGEDGIVISQNTGVGIYPYQYHLQLDADCERTITTEGSLTICADSEAPDVSFGRMTEEDAAGGMVKRILKHFIFDIFVNKGGSLPYSISDGNGCGVSESEYCIWRCSDENFDFGDIDESDIADIISRIDHREWIDCGEQGEILIPDADEEAYIVLIKTKDKVNNEKIYASNGIVVEHVMPEVRIEGLSKEIYGPDDIIECTVGIKDGAYQYRRNPNRGVSGIDKVEVSVLVDEVRWEEKSFIYYADSAAGESERYKDRAVAGDDFDIVLPLSLESVGESDHIEINVVAYDRAGNSQTVSRFIKTDYTAPKIDMLMARDKDGSIKTSYGNEDVVPAVMIEDRNLDASSVEVQLICDRDMEDYANHMHLITKNEMRQIAVFDNVEYLKERDGFYRVKASAKDKAGNLSEMEFLFSVNRFGAWYILSENTRELVDRYYTNGMPEIRVIAYNISSIEKDKDEVYYTRDGNTYKLDAGVEYIREESREEGYNKYTYILKADNFSQEGYYDVSIYSKDCTGNRMTNKLNQYRDDGVQYDADIRFVVDRTKPSVFVSGLEEDVYKEEVHRAEINIADNMAVASADVYWCIQEKDLPIDMKEAEPICHYNHTQIKELNGVLPLELSEEAGYQAIKIVAKDMAGNITETDTYHVMIARKDMGSWLKQLGQEAVQKEDITEMENTASKTVRDSQWKIIWICVIGGIITILILDGISRCILHRNER